MRRNSGRIFPTSPAFSPRARRRASAGVRRIACWSASMKGMYGGALSEPLEGSTAVVRFPLQLDVTGEQIGEDNERRAFTERPEGDAYAGGCLDVLNVWCVHHSPSPTVHTRIGSPTPFSACSPRSSKATPAEVRASDRTVSETSTSPGADSPLIREAMFTAPP